MAVNKLLDYSSISEALATIHVAALWGASSLQSNKFVAVEAELAEASSSRGLALLQAAESDLPQQASAQSLLAACQLPLCGAHVVGQRPGDAWPTFSFHRGNGHGHAAAQGRCRRKSQHSRPI